MPEPPPNSSAQAKKALVEAGLEVFRTRGDEIVLAERPRENLIMDSGVRLRVGATFEVRVVLRAQHADYPNEEETRLFARVRALAARVLHQGFVENATAVIPVKDPSDAEHTLDTFYEITYAKAAQRFDEALVELKMALALEKRA